MLIDIDLDLNMYLPVRLSFQNFFADGEVTFGGQSVSHKNEASSSTYSPKAGYIEASLCPNLSVFLIITDTQLGKLVQMQSAEPCIASSSTYSPKAGSIEASMCPMLSFNHY